MSSQTHPLNKLLSQIRACTLCAADLPNTPRPIVIADPKAKILIAGQAPGRRVHHTGIPFNDPSGDRLRQWLGVDRETFYDASKFAIVPMGFCYPGTGKSGDLPPRPECAATWHAQLLPHLSNIQLTLAIGQYAISYHLQKPPGTLTEVVRNWRSYWPTLMPLPHPSPRNNLWLTRNPWFEAEVVPALRQRVAALIQ